VDGAHRGRHVNRTASTVGQAEFSLGLNVRTIVLVNDAAFVRGGADRIVFDCAAGLAARGYKVVLFAGMGPVAPELGQNPDIEVVCANLPGLRQDSNRAAAFLRGLWNREAAAALRRVLGRFDPAETIVHVHLYMGVLSPSVPHMACAMGFKTVLTLHDYFLTCPNGAYFVFPESRVCQCRPLSAACMATHCDSRTRLHKPWRILRGFIQARAARLPRRLSGLIAVSEISRQTIQQHLPDGARIDVVPNIVGVPRRTQTDVTFRRNYIFSGRLENYKGPQLLAQASMATGLPVVFCGTGPMESHLRQMIPQARFTGWLGPAQLDQELRAARAFVFPSIVPETFGLSAAEALAHGLPVIASAGTAAREFVKDGVNGLLFAPGSAEDLAAKMRQLADPALATRLSENAYRNYWAAPFSLECHLDRLEKIYHRPAVQPSGVPQLALK
jgi:glycosyltransferase involved in cell wall biosynthesis